eukprot:NODE_519_length_6551_cov_0.408246.p4 type:complete len:141 gc:universal NODE_519_length_6551_cov_0.408246:5597-6019(+)
MEDKFTGKMGRVSLKLLNSMSKNVRFFGNFGRFPDNLDPYVLRIVIESGKLLGSEPVKYGLLLSMSCFKLGGINCGKIAPSTFKLDASIIVILFELQTSFIFPVLLVKSQQFKVICENSSESVLCIFKPLKNDKIDTQSS